MCACTTKNGIHVCTLDCSLCVRTTKNFILDCTAECLCIYNFVLLKFLLQVCTTEDFLLVHTTKNFHRTLIRRDCYTSVPMTTSRKFVRVDSHTQIDI